MANIVYTQAQAREKIEKIPNNLNKIRLTELLNDTFAFVMRYDRCDIIKLSRLVYNEQKTFLIRYLLRHLYYKLSSQKFKTDAIKIFQKLARQNPGKLLLVVIIATPTSMATKFRVKLSLPTLVGKPYLSTIKALNQTISTM